VSIFETILGFRLEETETLERETGVRWETRRHFLAEDKIGMVLDDLWSENNIAGITRRKSSLRAYMISDEESFLVLGSVVRGGCSLCCNVSQTFRNLRSVRIQIRDRFNLYTMVTASGSLI
jgi:hypothetical protein